MRTSTHQTTNQQNKSADPLFNPHQPVEKQSAAHTYKAPKSQAPFNFGSTPLFSPSPIILQPKLTINAPGDRYEQEADRIAEQVMRMPQVDAPTQDGNEAKVNRKPLVSQISPVIQRMPESMEDEEEDLVQTKLMPNIQRKYTECGDKEEDKKKGELLQTKPMPGIQRKCAKCGAEEEEHLQRKPLASQITPIIQRMPEAIEDEDEDLLQTKPIPSIQRKCAKCQKEEEEKKQIVQTKSAGASPRAASTSLTSRIQSSRGHGQAMDAATNSFMSSRFGTDFSRVRIHADSSAAEMSKEINAQAFTVGRDVYFNRGKFSPGTEEGKKLLAHELTHVVQQGGKIHRTLQRNPSAKPATKTLNGITFSVDSKGRLILTDNIILKEMKRVYKIYLKPTDRYAGIGVVRTVMAVLDSKFHTINKSYPKTRFVFRKIEYSGDQVNYLAVGMGFNHFHIFLHKLAFAMTMVLLWNLKKYKHLASPGEHYWASIGFLNYHMIK